MASVYLFLLGLSAGLTLVTISASHRLSPSWLKWLLVAAGAFIISRYVTQALFASTLSVERVWGFRRCWFATSLGFPLLAACAVDQLIRHPAMTPKKLLTWLSPFLAIYGAIILFAPMTATPDQVAGWTVHLPPVWQRLLGMTHLVYTACFIAVCVMVMGKIPSPPIRIALAGLIGAFLLLSLDGVLAAFHIRYFRPYLFSELVMLLALWHAFETAAIQSS